MTIRIYPSRLEGEPLETHETTERLSIAEWIRSIAPGYAPEKTDRHPTAWLNGRMVEHTEWELTFFGPDDQLDLYMEAKGVEVAVGAAIGLALVAAAMAMSIKTEQPRAQRQGNTLESPGLFANQVRWGDPIPQIAGSPLVHPDYIAPPRRYYVGKRQQWVDSLLCLGWGHYQKAPNLVFVGDTPATTLGDDLELRFFEPGETIPAPFNEWWHTPEEVGFTTMGGAGMTLGLAGGAGVQIPWPKLAGSVIVPGQGEPLADLTFAGNSITGSDPVPSSWETGILVRVEAAHPVTFNGNAISSELLDSLQLATGDEIELMGERSGEYTISAILPPAGGGPGSPARLTGSTAPARYDFGTTHATLVLTFGGRDYTALLTTDVAGLTELVAVLNSQLNGSPIQARVSGTVLELYQTGPLTGGSITASGDVVDLLGTPTSTAGVAATPAIPARYVVNGADFGTGTEVTAAGRVGMRYEVLSISGNTITVSPPGIDFWSGFPASVSGATSTVQVDRASLPGGWVGPFTAVPQGKLADAFEVDIFFPNGLIYHRRSGGTRLMPAEGRIQWRELGTTEWHSVPYRFRDATPDQIAFTIRVDLPRPMRVEVRVGATRAPSTNPMHIDKHQWSGLRSRIVGAPTSYPGMTLLHVRMRTGDKVSGQVENKISVRPVRMLPPLDDPEAMEPTRDIAPFFVYMMESVGYGRELIDMEHIRALHQIWRDRGDTFDLAVNAASTLKTVAGYCLQAGFAELTLHRGLISAARDAYRMGTPPRVYSPQELVSPLIETTETVMPDDIDGVDIEYKDRITGRMMTESYRLIGDQGLRVEKITAPGVTGRTQAWRLAARRRRKAAYRRTAYKGSTELAAMNSFYMDYVGLQDGIPEWGQSAFVVDHDGLTLTLSETVLPVNGDPVVMIRRPDGTASPPIPVTVNGRTVALSAMPPDVPVTNDPNHPTVVYIGSRTQVVHEALIVSVRPTGDNRVEFQAVNMDNRVYLEDDMGPDQVILTSRLYPIEFSDGIAPSFAGAGVERRAPYKDYFSEPEAVGVGLLAPAVSRTTAVRYLTYEDAESESISIGLTAPEISRRSVVKTYDKAEPEAIGVGLLAPAISRRNHPVYSTEEESISVGLLAPTIKRTNT